MHYVPFIPIAPMTDPFRRCPLTALCGSGVVDRCDGLRRDCSSCGDQVRWMAKHCSRISSSVGSYAVMVATQRGHRVQVRASHVYLQTSHVVMISHMSRPLLLERDPIALVVVQLTHCPAWHVTHVHGSVDPLRAHHVAGWASR